MHKELRKSGIRMLVVFCICSLLFTSLPYVVQEVQAASQTVVLDATALRTGPGESYRQIAKLSRGTPVTITDSSNSSWLKVKTAAGKAGYIAKSDAGDSSALTPEENILMTGTAVASINIRSGPGEGYRSLGVLQTGQKITVLDKSYPDWAKVEMESGSTGYAAKKYLTITTQTIPDPDPNVIDEVQSKIETITATASESAVIRSGPGEAYGILTTVSKGTKMEVLDKSYASWVKVKLSNNTVGYCSKSSVTLATTSSTVYNQLVQGNSGKAVTSMQQRLKELGYLLGGVTGTFDTATLNALKDFQQAAGFSPVDGVATHEVLKALYASDAPHKEEYEELKSGSTGEAVKKLQQRLKELNYFVTAVDSKFGTATVNAVKDFQKASSLSVTGVATVETQKELYKSSAKANTLTAKIYADVLNVRNGAGTSYTKVGQVLQNSTVTVLDYSTAGWYKIKTSTGLTGYVAVSGSDGQYAGILATNVYLDESTLSLSAAATGTLSATVTTPLAYNQKITWSSSDASVASVNSSGVVTGKSSGTATITAKASDGSGKSATCKVTITGGAPSFDSITLSHTSGSIPAGKTFSVSATTNPSAQKVYWSSSNSKVATVSTNTTTAADTKYGYVLGVSEGTATITAKDSSGTVKAAFKVTVTESEPVKFAYTSPNIASKGSTVNLIAITDKTRENVRFKVSLSSGTKTVTQSEKITDGNTYVWTAKLAINEAGTIDVKAESLKDGVWSTCDGAKTTAYITTSSNTTTPTLDERRASDEVIQEIANCEGFISEIRPDTLVSSRIPTIGYGQTYTAGSKFYNNITKKEGWALLVQSVNKGSYTTSVNSFLVKNNVKFNQQQFDALVCFSYNLGTGWIGNSTLSDILLASYEPGSDVEVGEKVITGQVNSSNGINVRSGPGTNYTILYALGNNVTITLESTIKYNGEWYKIKGKSEYVFAEYIDNIRTTTPAKGARNLNYINEDNFLNEILAYHHAGGVCLPGLFYRRQMEAAIFLYGDYKNYYGSCPYDFPIPNCIEDLL